MPRMRLTQRGLFSRTAAPDESSGRNPNVPIALYDTHPNARFAVGSEVTFIDDKWLKIKGTVLGHVAEDRLMVQWPNSIAQADVEDVVAFHETREGLGKSLSDPVIASRGSRRSSLITFDEVDKHARDALEKKDARQSGMLTTDDLRKFARDGKERRDAEIVIEHDDDDDLEYIPDRPNFLDGDPVDDEHPGVLPVDQDPRDKIEEVDDQDDCGCDSLEVMMLLPEIDDLTNLIEDSLTAARTAGVTDWWNELRQGKLKPEYAALGLKRGTPPGDLDPYTNSLSYPEYEIVNYMSGQPDIRFIGKDTQSGRLWFKPMYIDSEERFYLEPGYDPRQTQQTTQQTTQQQAPGESGLSTFGIKEWWNKDKVTNSWVLNELLSQKDEDGNPRFKDEFAAASRYNLFKDPGIIGLLQNYGMHSKDIKMFSKLREQQLNKADKEGGPRKWWQGTGVRLYPPGTDLRAASRRVAALRESKKSEKQLVLDALRAMKKPDGSKLFPTESDAALKYNLFDDPGVIRVLEEYGLSDQEIYDYSDLRQLQLKEAQEQERQQGRGRGTPGQSQQKWGEASGVDLLKGANAVKLGSTPLPQQKGKPKPVSVPNDQDLELVAGKAPGALPRGMTKEEQKRMHEKSLFALGKDAQGRMWGRSNKGVDYQMLPPGQKRPETPVTPSWQQPKRSRTNPQRPKTMEEIFDEQEGTQYATERGREQHPLPLEYTQNTVLKPGNQKPGAQQPRQQWTPEDEAFLKGTYGTQPGQSPWSYQYNTAASRQVKQLRRRAAFVNEFLSMPRVAETVRQAADVVEAVHELDTGDEFDETTKRAVKNASRNLLEATDHLYRRDDRIANMVAPQIEQLFADSLSN